MVFRLLFHFDDTFRSRSERKLLFKKTENKKQRITHFYCVYYVYWVGCAHFYLKKRCCRGQIIRFEMLAVENRSNQ